MYQFSFHADSLTDSLRGIQDLELSAASLGMPLEAMNGAQLEDVRNALISSLRRCVLYTTDLPARDTAAYIRLFRNAFAIRCGHILLSDRALAGVDDEPLREIIRMAYSFSIPVLFRPGANFPLTRWDGLRAPGAGLFYDPNEYVKLHVDPFHAHIYPGKYRKDIVFLRICDMIFDTWEPVLPEHGNAELKECASFLLASGFRGWFSFGTFRREETVAAFTQTLLEM